MSSSLPGIPDISTDSAGQLSATAAVTAHAISDTLRIPLAARALGDSLFPEVAVHDASARDALARLGDDGSLWLKQRSTVYGVLARICVFRDLALDYLKDHPAGHVVNLGCGLSHYFQWLDNGQARMTDADLPDVIALRRAFLGLPGERHALLDLDLCQPGWWDRLGLPKARDAAPVFLMSEGVLMYLPATAVSAILAEFGERASAGSVFAFDSMCWLVAGRGKQHPSIRHTHTEISWGLRRPADLLEPHPRLRLAAAHRVMEGYGLPHSILGPMFRGVLRVPLYAVYELRTRDD
ncbi:class I SAM-dependent methyltransferase [Burkholderia sp. AU45388]|uniref:class I SAM-dependent methyltransferase n=1 Tax=Burkholderia sp. AU45388 TaxID=3059206 RepID=UPI00265087DE|nr:class I SAM-dependent methyltransferase [Burkholderia sp. AU45388]MDN7430767.1 class I SAM-dependent methyltransferase [Burkholderia sp. AU45388]